jgi:hypothetical protein
MQQDPQQIIWLASYQKSGNTWMRVFLANYFAPKDQRLTINQLDQFTTGDLRLDFFDKAAGGQFTGQTVEESIRIRPAVQRLIARSKSGHHFVKTHSQVATIEGVPLINPEVTAAAIYIMRNPFDVIPSFARHSGRTIDEMIDAMVDPNAIFRSADGIFEVIGRWDEHIESWLAAPGLPHHQVRYEDMLADTPAEMRKVLEFLRIPVQMGQLKRAIRASSFSELRRQERQQGFSERPAQMDAFFHSGKSGGWREVLTPEQVARIRWEFKDAIEKYYPELLEPTAEFAGTA